MLAVHVVVLMIVHQNQYICCDVGRLYFDSNAWAIVLQGSWDLKALTHFNLIFAVEIFRAPVVIAFRCMGSFCFTFKCSPLKSKLRCAIRSMSIQHFRDFSNKQDIYVYRPIYVNLINTPS